MIPLVRTLHHTLAHALAVASIGLVAAIPIAACDDGSGPTVAPGNVTIDDSMQDAVALLTQEGGYAPQGIGDAGDGSAYPISEAGITEAGGSVGYADVQSPMTACSSCKCDMRVGYCLENGSSLASTAAPIDGFCGLAKTADPSVGCNALPAACTATPTCECVLDAIQPPLGCYPECTDSAGFLDVFCAHP